MRLDILVFFEFAILTLVLAQVIPEKLASFINSKNFIGKYNEYNFNGNGGHKRLTEDNGSAGGTSAGGAGSDGGGGKGQVPIKVQENSYGQSVITSNPFDISDYNSMQSSDSQVMQARRNRDQLSRGNYNRGIHHLMIHGGRGSGYPKRGRHPTMIMQTDGNVMIMEGGGSGFFGNGNLQGNENIDYYYDDDEYSDGSGGDVFCNCRC